LCILHGREHDPKFDRAAVRWVRRMQLEHSLRRQEVELLRAAMAALGSRFDAVALNALLETCRELGLVPPTVPGYPGSSWAFPATLQRTFDGLCVNGWLREIQRCRWPGVVAVVGACVCLVGSARAEPHAIDVKNGRVTIIDQAGRSVFGEPYGIAT